MLAQVLLLPPPSAPLSLPPSPPLSLSHLLPPSLPLSLLSSLQIRPQHAFGRVAQFVTEDPSLCPLILVTDEERIPSLSKALPSKTLDGRPSACDEAFLPDAGVFPAPGRWQPLQTMLSGLEGKFPHPQTAREALV